MAAPVKITPKSSVNCRRTLTVTVVTLALLTTAALGQEQTAPKRDVATPPGQASVIRIEPPDPGIGIKDWVPAIGGLLGLLGALAAVWMGMRNTRLSLEAGQRNADAALGAAQRTSEANLWQKANENELKDIQAKLDGFYGPFMQMSEANRLLAEELRGRQTDRETYRLLMKLFDKAWEASLPVGDRTLVREICKNATVLETFIREKAAMVDDKLLPYLSRASVHYRILHLAYKGELGADSTNFRIYVFPYQLTNVLEIEVERLRRRCAQLRAGPYAPPGPIPPLVIPEGSDYQLPPWPSPPRAPQNARAVLNNKEACEVPRSPSK